MNEPPPEYGIAKEAKPRRRWSRLLVTFAILVAVIMVVRFFIFEPVRVVGSSMQPGLSDGDRLLVNRIGRLFGLPGRSTIVVCYFKQRPGVKCIKRLVGLPGDVIEIRHGHLYVNDELVIEPYKRMKRPENQLPTKLGPDQVYVLGDNRESSGDSRIHGPVSAGNVSGRAFFRFWPLSRFGFAE